MEATIGPIGLCWGMGLAFITIITIEGICWDDGKENANYHLGFRVSRVWGRKVWG